MIAAAGLQLLTSLGLLIFAIPAVRSEGGDPAGYAAVSFGAAVFLVFAAIGLFGATSMRKLRNYSFSVVASVVAAVAGPGAILGLPFGVWACLELIRPETRAAFAANRSPTGPTGAPDSAKMNFARAQVKGPAIGLVVTGVLDWVLMTAFCVFISFSIALESPGSMFVWLPLLAMALSSGIIYAGLKMMQLERRGMVMVGSVLALLVSPGNLIGLPLGIWALVTLNRREVREAFGANRQRADKTIPSIPTAVQRPDRFWRFIVIGFVVIAVLGLLGNLALRDFFKARNVPQVICKTIQTEVGHQLHQAGATYDSLQVTVAEQRDSGTPFTVSYKGLRHFKYTHDGQPDPNWPASADGQFIMQYIGGSQWQGALGDTQFTVQAGTVDNINLPFIDDPPVIGEWQSVDFVAQPSDFNPDQPQWKRALFLKGLTFLANGRMQPGWLTWTKGVVMHHGDKTASRYEIREINGQFYMFFEWKSGDSMILGRKPPYYVLKKISSAALTPTTGSIKSDYIGQAWFPLGDSIELTSVERTPEQMTVRGHYNLVSHDGAQLALYVTSTNKNVPGGNGEERPISKGRGDFTLMYLPPILGLPHVSMYGADGHTFASLYFGTTAEALAESKAGWITNEMSADTETWSPTLAPGEKPDLQKILNSAQNLMAEGSYEESLQHYLWYFDHSRNDAGQRGVRLSFALSGWIELGRRYPKASQALIEIRDADARQFSEGEGDAVLFQEIAGINQYRNDDEATLALFKSIESRDSRLAEQCFFFAENLLVLKGDYETCRKYMGDPQAAFERVRQSWQQLKQFEEQNAARNEEQRKRFQEMAKTNSLYAHLPVLPTPPPFADDHFVAQTRQLIEILVATGEKPEAEKIQGEALAVLNDPKLKSAVTDAEEKIRSLGERSDFVPSLSVQPPVVVETFPVSGARDVPPGITEIRVRFSKPMADGSWSWSTAWENSVPESVGPPHYLADLRTCVMKVRLEPGRTYAWWLNSNKFKNFTDQAGRPAVPYLLIFQTRQN